MTHHDLQELLQNYAAGRLSATEAAEVKKVLADDPGLEEFSEFVIWLQLRLESLGNHLPGLHPTGEQLVVAALGPLGESSIPADEEPGEWVVTHLDGCAECRELVVLIGRTEQQADDSGLAARPSRQRSIFSLQRSWPKFAMAASLAVLLVVGGMFVGNRSTAPVAEPFRLAAVSRAVIETPVVTLTPRGEIPPLILAFDPWVGRLSAEDYTLQISLVFHDEPSREWPLTQTTAAGWQSDLNGVALDLKLKDPGPDGIRPGRYGLEVRDDAGLVIYQGEFRLVPHAE